MELARWNAVVTTIAIAERLDKAGADLVSLSESIDTTNAAGKMIFRMLAVLAEFERDLVSERTKAALSVKRARGERLGGHMPYGFDVAADGATLIENRAEQAVIRDILAMRSQGTPLVKIAGQLTARGVRTKHGNAAWSHQTVRAIIQRNNHQNGSTK